MGIDDFLATLGANTLPDIAGSYQGRGLVICADAHCVWDDLERLGAKNDSGRGRVVAPQGWHFMMVNRIGQVFPGDVEHWYCNDGAWLERIVAVRRPEYKAEFVGPNHLHSRNRKGSHHCWPWVGSGTSGLGAILTGLALGYEKIILCGMPLDDAHHNGEPPWRRTKFQSGEAANQVNGKPPRPWAQAMRKAFDGKVQSMSGRTKEWLNPSTNPFGLGS